MIRSFLISLIVAFLFIAGLAFIGWVMVTLVEQHPRFFIGFSVCALAAICYVELGPESLEQH